MCVSDFFGLWAMVNLWGRRCVAINSDTPRTLDWVHKGLATEVLGGHCCERAMQWYPLSLRADSLLPMTVFKV